MPTSGMNDPTTIDSILKSFTDVYVAQQCYRKRRGKPYHSRTLDRRMDD